MSYPVRGPMPCMGIDGKASAAASDNATASITHSTRRKGAA